MLEHDRRESRGSKRFAGRRDTASSVDLTFAGDRGGDVRHRCEIAARSDGTELGDARHDVVLEQLDHRFENLDPDPAPAGGELRQTRDENRARFVEAEERSDARAVKAEQIHRELGAVLGRDRVDDRRAEARVDTVERLAALDASDHRGALALHALAPGRIRGQAHGHFTARDPGDVAGPDPVMAQHNQRSVMSARSRSRRS